MKKYNALLILFSLFLITCVDDVRDVEDINRTNYEPEIAVPLGQGTFSFSDIIGDDDASTYLVIDEDEVINFIYSGEITRNSSLDFFDNIDLLPYRTPDSNNVVPMNFTNSIKLRYARFSGGNLTFGSKNIFDYPIMIELELPELTLNGVGFKKTFGPFNPDPDNLFFLSQPLAGMDLNLTANQMIINAIGILPDGTRVELPGSSSGGFLLNMTFSYVEGYWENEEIPIDKDTIEIEVFETLRRGDMFFEEPIINITMDNSFGFPVRSSVEALEFLKLDGGILKVESPYVDNGFEIAYPRLNEIGEYKKTVFTFNKDNSNLPEATSIKPLALYYDMFAIANPDRDTSIVGFMTDSSEIIVSVQVILPLHGSARDFEARDTIDFDFPETDSDVDIKSGELKMIFENTIPVGMDIQTYLADANGNIIDSLLGENILEIEGFDDTGGVSSAKTVHYVKFDQERYELWRKGKKVYMFAKFTTVDYPETVKIKADSYLKLKMGLKAKLTNL